MILTMILKPVSILAQDVDSTLRYTTVVTDQEWHEQARAGVARAGVARAGVARAGSIFRKVLSKKISDASSCTSQVKL